jgi:hypothetical protein
VHQTWLPGSSGALASTVSQHSEALRHLRVSLATVTPSRVSSVEIRSLCSTPSHSTAESGMTTP